MNKSLSEQTTLPPPNHLLQAGSFERYDIGINSDMMKTGALAPFSKLSKYAPAAIEKTRPHSYWRESLTLIQQYVPYVRCKLRSNERVYLHGDSFEKLYLISSGLFKVVDLTQDGCEQPIGVYFKGDWLGFDGIPTGQYNYSSIALDCAEVWSIRYDSLLQAGAKEPMLMRVILAALSEQLALNRDVLLSIGRLPSDARVCDFLLQWAHSLEERGLRTDQFNVYLTRADIGHYLGLRLESVSRSLSRLARCGIIQFNEKGRREISIPDINAMSEFIQAHSGANN